MRLRSGSSGYPIISCTGVNISCTTCASLSHCINYYIILTVGRIETTTKKLQGFEGSNESHFVQTFMVHHDRAVPDEVCLE